MCRLYCKLYFGVSLHTLNGLFALYAKLLILNTRKTSIFFHVSKSSGGREIRFSAHYLQVLGTNLGKPYCQCASSSPRSMPLQSKGWSTIVLQPLLCVNNFITTAVKTVKQNSIMKSACPRTEHSKTSTNPHWARKIDQSLEFTPFLKQRRFQQREHVYRLNVLLPYSI